MRQFLHVVCVPLGDPLIDHGIAIHGQKARVTLPHLGRRVVDPSLRKALQGSPNLVRFNALFPEPPVVQRLGTRHGVVKGDEGYHVQLRSNCSVRRTRPLRSNCPSSTVQTERLKRLQEPLPVRLIVLVTPNALSRNDFVLLALDRPVGVEEHVFARAIQAALFCHLSNLNVLLRVVNVLVHNQGPVHI